MTLRTAKVSKRSELMKLHGSLDVGAGRMPVHYEKVGKGVYRQTDRAHCCICGADDKAAEIERLKARIAELEGRS